MIMFRLSSSYDYHCLEHYLLNDDDDDDNDGKLYVRYWFGETRF